MTTDISTSRTALVTGANQGLGLAVVRGLAQRMNPGDRVLMTGRDPQRLEAAARELGDVTARVYTRLLDVSDDRDAAGIAKELAEHDGGVDIVISNAGARISPERPPAEQVDDLVATTNLGTTRMLREFTPILKPDGRFLVVASSFGTLGHLDPALRPQFDEARTLEDVETIVESWRQAVHDGTAEQQGWPHWLNVPSKVAQVAAVRVVARQRRQVDLAEGTLIASVCPGLFDTEASRPWFTDMSKAQTPAEAAEALLSLVLSPVVDPALCGELVRFGQVLPWLSQIAPEATAGARVVHT
jgi:NAD(P)-dependent dehydrogenase (short-subunit alcohol dehydrogenase family)